MADFCRDRGIAFFMGIVPWPPQVSTEEWKTGKWLSYGYRPEEGEPSTVYQKRLTDYANRHDIVAVDLLPPFRSASATGSSKSHLFLDYDGHMTALGHAVAAQSVRSEVEALLNRGTKD
jgi:hypothetical protein